MSKLPLNHLGLRLLAMALLTGLTQGDRLVCYLMRRLQ